MKKLSYLQLFFVLYFFAKVIVEIILGYGIYEDALESIEIPWFIKSPGAFVFMTIVSNVILFAIGFLFLYYLVKKQNWARVVFLIIGIINIIDALSGLAFNAEIIGIINRFFGSVEWGKIILLDRITDILGLVFWGYTVYLLLFDKQVTKLFKP